MYLQSIKHSFDIDTKSRHKWITFRSTFADGTHFNRVTNFNAHVHWPVNSCCVRLVFFKTFYRLK